MCFSTLRNKNQSKNEIKLRKGSDFMYKKVVSVLLSVLLLAIGVASPRIIDSFDNLLENLPSNFKAELSIEDFL